MKHATLMARSFKNTLGSASFWLGLLPSMGLLGGLYLAMTAEEPVNLNSVAAAGGASIQGRFLTLRIQADIEADCPAEVHRWVMRRIGTDERGRPVWDTHPIKHDRNPVVGTGQGLRWAITLPLPASVGPGHWFYHSRSFDGCRWGTRLGAALFGRPRRDSPLVPFEVVTPTADTPPAVVSAPGPVTVIPE